MFFYYFWSVYWLIFSLPQHKAHLRLGQAGYMPVSTQARLRLIFGLMAMNRTSFFTPLTETVEYFVECFVDMTGLSACLLATKQALFCQICFSFFHDEKNLWLLSDGLQDLESAQ